MITDPAPAPTSGTLSPSPATTAPDASTPEAAAFEEPPRPALPLTGAVLALVAGAFAMGASVLFVRLADVGPFASAFWRAALALPPLALWAYLAEGRAGLAMDRRSALAGLLFAGDLICWHLSILGTSVANATALATTSPIWVTLFTVMVLRQPLSRASLLGLLICMAGAGALVGRSWRFSPEHLLGDALGLVTALFFAGYFLAVREARRARGPASITFQASIVTAGTLLCVALLAEPTLWPRSLTGAGALLALALVAQVGGLGLMAVGLDKVPAVFGSLVFFLEVVSAAALGWLVLGEALDGLQVLGMGLIVIGLVVARPRARPEAEALPR